MYAKRNISGAIILIPYLDFRIFNNQEERWDKIIWKLPFHVSHNRVAYMVYCVLQTALQAIVNGER